MSGDRIKGAIVQFIEQVFPRLDYLALYPAKVNAQNSDLTLELRPDDARLPDHSKVPIRHGVPNMQVKVSAGARVLLGFEGGDPSKPVATLWESASVTELVFNGDVIKLKNGNTPVAKKGSVTAGHTHNLTGNAGPYPISPSSQALTATDQIDSNCSDDVKVP